VSFHRFSRANTLMPELTRNPNEATVARKQEHNLHDTGINYEIREIREKENLFPFRVFRVFRSFLWPPFRSKVPKDINYTAEIATV
jgi:hypothetical protein